MANKYHINSNHEKASLDIFIKEEVEFKTGQNQRSKKYFIILKVLFYK